MNGILDEFKNAWNRPNNAVVQIILINVVIFVILAVLRVVSRLAGIEPLFELVYDQFSIPPRLNEFIFRPWTIITYAFAHSMQDIFHILFNMLVFYWFGKLIQEYLGSKRVVSIYILGAITGSTLYLLAYNLIPFYVERTGFPGMVGASGAVYAIVVGAAVFMPNYTFFLLLIGPVRIKYIAAFTIFISFLGSVGSNAGGNLAHLGGALMGWLFISQLQKGTDLGKPIIGILTFFKSFFVRQPNIKVTHRSSRKSRKPTSKKRYKSPVATEPKQEEIDAILDKISQSGYESLSKEEKQKLFNASKK